MEISSTRLCCIFGAVFLTGSVVAQTTIHRETSVNRNKSKNYKYVPYGSTVTHSDGYQRRKAPTSIKLSTEKELTHKDQKEGSYAIRRVPTSSEAKKQVLAEKRDTVSFQLYSQTIEKNRSKNLEQKEVRRVVNKTLPLSCFQQNGSLK